MQLRNFLIVRFYIIILVMSHPARTQKPEQAYCLDSRMQQRLLSLILVLGSLGVSTKGSATEPSPQNPDTRQENIVFTLPGLNAWNRVRASWALVRERKFWIQDQRFDLTRIPWPTWDTQQIPYALTPTNKYPASLIFLNDQFEEIRREKFDRPWNPWAKSANSPANEPTFFQVELVVSPSLTIRSARQSVPHLEPVLNCRVDLTRNPKGAISTNRRVDLCLASLNGVLQEKSQWFIDVLWPRTEDREQNKDIAITDLKMRRGFATNKHLYQSNRNPTAFFELKAGRTGKEQLLPIQWEEGFPSPEEHVGSAPALGESDREIAAQQGPNGSSYGIQAHFGDFVERGSLRIEKFFRSPTFVEFIEGPEYGTRQTNFPEYNTGPASHLRNALLAAGTSLESFWSNRGERQTYMGLGFIESSLRLEDWHLRPSLLLNRDLVHMGSSLSVTEVQTNLAYEIDPKDKWFPYIGLLAYAVSGNNLGSSRLGSYSAFPVGVQFLIVDRPSFVSGHAAVLTSFGGQSVSLGWDSRVAWQRFLKPHAREGYYWGTFLTLAHYRANLIVPKNLTRETFTETRVNLGFTFGWAGSQFLGQNL